MSNTGWAVTIIALIIILAGGWMLFSQGAMAPATTNATANGTDGANTNTNDTQGNNNAGTGAGAGVDVNAGVNAANTTTVHYTATGFTPKSITVPVGGAVSFVNDTAGAMWVGADEHPTHTEYDGTDRATHCSGTYTGATPFDQCQSGSSYTFVFTKAGTYEYHNHAAAQFQGTVTVQ